MTDADLARWEAQDHADGAPGMHQEIQALLAEVRRLRAMLREVEWAGIIWTDTRTCLFCPSLHPDEPPAQDGRPEDRGHRPDCRWVAAVGDAAVARAG
jgi:hypothetical protein